MKPREQGDLGEQAAVRWLWSKRAAVFVPLGHSPDYDLIADFGEGPLRVQVKTSSYFREGRFHVLVATFGGNRSWGGVVKHFTPERCDYLFVAVADGRQWFIPAAKVGRKAIRLGGPKFARFEVESGLAMPAG